ncbi:MAG: RlmE family RNA methyltransferase [Anaplasma sp.]
MAKKQGYRSRSAYKLIDIDNKFKIFQRGRFVLDLGSYPGGWAQVAAERVTCDDKVHVVAVDVKEMEKIPNVDFVQCDVEDSSHMLYEVLQNGKFDVVLSDMAPKSCGHKQVDHANIINLCEVALNLAVEFLRPGGSFVTKILQGEFEQELYRSLRCYFRSVAYFKPKSSRNESSEIYLVGTDFRDCISSVEQES